LERFLHVLSFDNYQKLMKQNLEKGHRQPLRLSVSYGLIWFCVILIVHSELKIFPKASSHF